MKQGKINESATQLRTLQTPPGAFRTILGTSRVVFRPLALTCRPEKIGHPWLAMPVRISESVGSMPESASRAILFSHKPSVGTHLVTRKKVFERILNQLPSDPISPQTSFFLKIISSYETARSNQGQVSG